MIENININTFDPFSNLKDVSEDLKQILVEKYGDPLRNIYTRTCYWKGDGQYNILSLKYSSFGEPVITYCGGDYHKKYLEEVEK